MKKLKQFDPESIKRVEFLVLVMMAASVAVAASLLVEHSRPGFSVFFIVLLFFSSIMRRAPTSCGP